MFSSIVFLGLASVGRVYRLEVRVYAHSTEDPERVVRAVLNVFPEDVGEVRFRRRIVSGQYGDSITILRAELRGSKARRVLRHVVQGLDDADFERLLSEVSSRVDESGNLYVRLDKQEAYLGRVRLMDSDPIRLKFSIKLNLGEDPPSVAEKLLRELRGGGGG